MASPASSEASEIRRRGRQRLIGAVALVLLLVVFVPMVLDSEPRPARPQPGIPSRENAPPLPPPAPSAAKSTEAKTAEPPKVAETKVAETKVAAKGTDPFAPKSGTPPKVAEPKAAPSPKLEGFAVQVGAFRDEAKLKQARDKMAAAGVTHYTERLEASGGPLTRLRAGPFPTREAAETAQATLKRAALDGKVVPLP
jgi:DedD protein